jgi:hypothetical protein
VDVVFDFCVVVVIKAEGVVYPGKRETMNAGYFFGVFTRLE